ncbi:MAG: hypothetical protein D6690_14510 [Nitrospirae bacterium]|nr:MAG: hypothetical protein D6690_14510 [Nitrospirota bacterium]
MANYIALCRSNYFAVRNPDDFRQFCQDWGLGCISKKDTDTAQELFGFVNNDGGIPAFRYDSKTNDFVEDTLFEHLAGHIQPGWVAIVQEVGFEKLRYLVGYAVAVSCDGELETVALSNIYALAAEHAEFPITPCEY